MENITFQQLVGLAAVVLVLIGAYNTVMTAIKTHREEKRRKDAPVNTLETTVKEQGEKLNKHGERLSELEESNRIIMRALMAMLSHEINGNSDERLRAAFDEIQNYLVEK